VQYLNYVIGRIFN